MPCTAPLNVYALVSRFDDDLRLLPDSPAAFHAVPMPDDLPFLDFDPTSTLGCYPLGSGRLLVGVYGLCRFPILTLPS